jgi:hypothetical protein
MVEPSNGLVISYNYLWARGHDRDEESGRKPRPTVIDVYRRKGVSLPKGETSLQMAGSLSARKAALATSTGSSRS